MLRFGASGSLVSCATAGEQGKAAARIAGSRRLRAAASGPLRRGREGQRGGNVNLVDRIPKNLRVEPIEIRSDAFPLFEVTEKVRRIDAVDVCVNECRVSRPAERMEIQPGPVEADVLAISTEPFPEPLTLMFDRRAAVQGGAPSSGRQVGCDREFGEQPYVPGLPAPFDVFQEPEFHQFRMKRDVACRVQVLLPTLSRDPALPSADWEDPLVDAHAKTVNASMVAEYVGDLQLRDLFTQGSELMLRG